MNKKFLSFLALGLLVTSSFCAESDELVAERAAASNSTSGVSPALAALLTAEEVEWGSVLRAVDLPTRGQDARTEVSSVQGGKKKKKGQKTPIVSFEEFYAPLEGDIREAEKSESPKEKLEALSKDYQNVVNTLNKIKKTKAVNKFPVEDANKLKAYEKAVKIIREKLKNLNKLSGDAKATERDTEARELAKIEADRAEAARQVKEAEAAERKALKHTQQWKTGASDATPMAEEMVKDMTGEAALNLMYIQSISFFGAENQKDQAVPFKEDFEKMTRCIMDWKSNPHMEITVHACPVCGSVNEKPCTIRNAMQISENVRTKYSGNVLTTIIDIASDKAEQNCLVIEKLKKLKDCGVKSTRSFQLYIQLLEKLCQDKPGLQMKHIGYLSLLANNSIGVPFEHVEA